MSQAYLFSERDRAEFERIRRKIDSIRGPGVTNMPDAISIAIVATATRRTGEAGGDARLPVGQYVGMFYGDVGPNVAGFSYIFTVESL